MSNSWVEHIKQYALDNNMTYACALSKPDAAIEYRKKQNKQQQNKMKEYEIKEIEKEYKSLITGDIIRQESTGKRTPKTTSNTLLTLKNQYKSLTGKELPSITDIKKDIKKTENKQKKEEDKYLQSDEYKKKQEQLKNQEPIIVKRKKISGVIL